MILYAMVVRARDGLILCDSTDVKESNDKDLKLSKRCMKQLARKLRRFDDRCLMQVAQHSICSVTSLDVGYICLCEASYPDVLAFAFLEEMLKQFVKLYDVPTVDHASRPFAFIEFDRVIQKLRQKYNSKNAVVQRLNFGALTEELRLRPPSVIGRNELEDLALPPSVYADAGVGSVLNDSNGVAPSDEKIHFRGREEVVFAPLTITSLFWMVVTGLFAALNFYRGVLFIHMADVFEIDGPTVSHGVALILESLLQCSQIYCVGTTRPGREFGSIAIAVLQFWLISYLWSIREGWLSVLHIFSAAIMAGLTVTRDYSVRATKFSV